MSKIEFNVSVKPREILRKTNAGLTPEICVVYDIYVNDRANGNLLVFSNQGYENRQDAVDIATKLFAGRPAEMHVYDGDGFLDQAMTLAAL